MTKLHLIQIIYQPVTVTEPKSDRFCTDPVVYNEQSR